MIDPPSVVMRMSFASFEKLCEACLLCFERINRDEINFGTKGAEIFSQMVGDEYRADCNYFIHLQLFVEIWLINGLAYGRSL